MKLMSEKALYEVVNQLSLEFFNKPFKHNVRFNHRLRTTGGRYIPFENRIEVNPKYVMEASDKEFYGIIKHELCHYHLHIEGRGYKHGDKEFKELLKKTGSPRHCQPLPSNEKQYKNIYECKRCDYLYKRVRKINVNKYRCGKCKGEIKLITSK